MKNTIEIDIDESADNSIKFEFVWFYSKVDELLIAEMLYFEKDVPMSDAASEYSKNERIDFLEFFKIN